MVNMFLKFILVWTNLINIIFVNHVIYKFEQAIKIDLLALTP
jgi:hypothetical protein